MEIAELTPSPTTGTENIYYQTLQDIGPLPTKWWMDLDETVVEAVTAPQQVPYPVIRFDRTPVVRTPMDQLRALPVQVWWAILSLAVIAIVACAWMLLP
jgi:hypothetical protein